jgi:hypothetical protein
VIATMSATGQITIQAENGVEAFALKQWAEKSIVWMRDEKLNEGHFVRGSGLLVDPNVPMGLLKESAS